MIEVTLPENVKRYPVKDLPGIVMGSDRWRQPIPGTTQGFLRVENHKVRLTIIVPGAPRMVHDIIEIRSRVLREKQVLTITF